MKKIAIIVCGLALAGCGNEWAKISTAVGQIDNTLAKLSGGSIPKACAIFLFPFSRNSPRSTVAKSNFSIFNLSYFVS